MRRICRHGGIECLHETLPQSLQDFGETENGFQVPRSMGIFPGTMMLSLTVAGRIHPCDHQLYVTLTVLNDTEGQKKKYVFAAQPASYALAFQHAWRRVCVVHLFISGV